MEKNIIYRVVEPSRELKSLERVINDMSNEGWDFVQALTADKIIFRRVETGSNDTEKSAKPRKRKT